MHTPNTTLHAMETVTQAQECFDKKYIAASEIMEQLGVTRAALLYARRTNRLPQGIVVSKGLLFIWEREQVEAQIREWKAELEMRRKGQV